MMNRAALVIVSCAVALGGCVSRSALPLGFNGLWAADHPACLDLDSDAGMTVSADRLQFYEQGADVIGIRSAGADHARLDVDWWDINDADEDDRPIVRRRIVEMRLSEDGSALSLMLDGARSRYVRCDGAALLHTAPAASSNHPSEASGT